MISSCWQKFTELTYALKKSCMICYLAFKHPQVNILTKLFVFSLICYAFSPIDLIPDFIPVIGLLDDIVLIPFGVYLVKRFFIQQEIWDECEEEFKKNSKVQKPKLYGYFGALFVIIFYSLIVYWVFQKLTE
eukprot:gene12366-6034_t